MGGNNSFNSNPVSNTCDQYCSPSVVKHHGSQVGLAGHLVQAAAIGTLGSIFALTDSQISLSAWLYPIWPAPERESVLTHPGCEYLGSECSGAGAKEDDNCRRWDSPTASIRLTEAQGQATGLACCGTVFPLRPRRNGLRRECLISEGPGESPDSRPKTATPRWPVRYVQSRNSLLRAPKGENHSRPLPSLFRPREQAITAQYVSLGFQPSGDRTALGLSVLARINLSS